MSVAPALHYPRLKLFASSIEEIPGESSLFKIAFRGFEDSDHWAHARKSAPSFFLKNRYTQITLYLDEAEKQIWVLNEDIFRCFMETAAEIQTVLQHFPAYLIQKLHSHVHRCTLDQVTENDVARMVHLGNRCLQQAELKCIKKQAIRTLIAGQGQSFILFSKFTKRKDKCVGSGSIKRVKLALKIQNAQIYAAAISRREYLEEMDWRLLANEVKLLNELRGLSGLLQIEASLEQEGKFYILTEFLNCGDLQRVFDNKWQFTLQEKIQTATELALGLLNLHSLGIIHRDLKPSNILISVHAKGIAGRKIKAVIGDLGAACRQNQRDFIENRTGTLAYIAPEKLASFWDHKLTGEWVKHSTEEADIWSFGMILFSLFHRETGTLMNFQNDRQIESRIEKLTMDEIEREIEKSGIPETIKPLIHRMLQIDYRKRCSALWLYKELVQIKGKPPEAGAVEELKS